MNMINIIDKGVKPNVEAEQSVIGAILLNSETVMPELIQVLSVDDFFVSELRTVFKVCCNCFTDGKPVDVVTVLARLDSEYKPIVSKAGDLVPSISNWKDYAKIVADTSKRIRAYEKTQELLEALVMNEDIAECQNAAATVCELLTETKSDNTVSATEGFVQFYTSLKNNDNYIKTGFANIDKGTYIRKGDYVIVGARPSVGKTAFTLQMMLNVSKTHRTVYFSLETRNNSLFGRMAANITDTDMREIKTLKGLDYKKLGEAFGVFEELDFYCTEATGWTVAQIRAKAVQLGADVIFVDYLGLVVDKDGRDLYERTTNISQGLKRIALGSNMAVIAACQLNRKGENEPTMANLRESGQIEQDADVIMLLDAPEGTEENKRVCIIEKNKEGETGRASFNFNGSVQRFCEYDTRHE